MAKQRDRLGRGLGALLGDFKLPEPGAAPADAQASIEVASVAPNPFQPRRDFSEEELEDLTASICENGLLQPILVRPAPGERGSVRYELVAGERRWRAAMRLGWTKIPAVVREVDDRTLLVLALVENLQRSQLSAIEEAEGFRRLGEEFSLSQQQIAEVVGRDRSTVANSMRLLQLPASVRQMVSVGRLSAGHARALLGLGNDRRMAELARQAADQGWSVREVEAKVQRTRPGGRTRSREEVQRDPNEKALEEELQRILGTQARIRRGRSMRGRIEIPFHNAEDFERIFEIVAGRTAVEVVS
ncbi:MAG: ParB/RepB/Spo0J family partition protein [Longimicrobiales bacterium]